MRRQQIGLWSHRCEDLGLCSRAAFNVAVASREAKIAVRNNGNWLFSRLYVLEMTFEN
jgi:hypothetical protein